MIRSTWSTAPLSRIVLCSIADLIVVEVRDRRAARRAGGSPTPRQLLAGQADEHGALALAQVVAGRLAGDLGIAEDAEQVVAQLERDAERQPELAQRRELVERGARRASPPITSGDSTLYFADL